MDAFHGSQWRLDVPIASRVGADSCEPVVRFKIGVVPPGAAEQAVKDTWHSLDYRGLAALADALKQAEAAINQGPYRKLRGSIA